jgi:hypothetical protein
MCADTFKFLSPWLTTMFNGRWFRIEKYFFVSAALPCSTVIRHIL